jgi:hypothetical protein
MQFKDFFPDFPKESLIEYDAKELQSGIFWNEGHIFKFSPLPIQAQVSPIFGISIIDYDKDGKKDLLLCGNQLHTRLRFGHYDANFGVLLHNNGKGNFSCVPQQKSGFHLSGEVRSILTINDKLYFGINQQKVVAYGMK